MLSLLGPRGQQSGVTTSEASQIARASLALLRQNQSFGMSLKKAVRLKFVYLSKVIGSDDGKGNYAVEVVKANKLQQRLK